MELNDTVLRRISTNLGSEWEKLASYLEFTQAEIEQFMTESTVKATENAIFAMLVAWREKKPVGTTNYRKELKDALEKCGRCDIADIIHADSPQAQLDAIYSSLTSKLKTKPELFEDAINAFFSGYVSLTTDLELAGALINFGKSMYSPQAQLDAIYSSLTSKLKTKPELFEDAINAFFSGYVSLTTDLELAGALINFGKSMCAGNTTGKEECKEKVLPPKKWKQRKKILKISEEYGDEFDETKAITCHRSGEYAVVDDIRHKTGKCGYTSWRRVHAFREDGSQRFVLNSKGAPELPNGMLNAISGVAVTKQGYYAVTDRTAQVKLFDIKGQNVGSFSTSEEDEGGQEAGANCIAVNSNGEIYVGDFHEQLITLHNADDFTKLGEIHVGISPSYIAVNNHGQVCVGTCEYLHVRGSRTWFQKVSIFDDSGNEISTISSTIWGKNATPCCVVYDEDDTLLLAVLIDR
ncbi:uncharacterized protein [Amphiura filiformis]|uniref:uncharacterized protein n=1 Tax=Amphiura filiformis TaxID=82378 RepID=UPI003B20F0C2